jgi:hypothetical protein
MVTSSISAGSPSLSSGAVVSAADWQPATRRLPNKIIEIIQNIFFFIFVSSSFRPLDLFQKSAFD